MTSLSEQLVFEVDEGFVPCASKALARLAYLYPDTPMKLRDGAVYASCGDDDLPGLRKEVAYAFYRERIALETRDLRQTLFDAVFHTR